MMHKWSAIFSALILSIIFISMVSCGSRRAERSIPEEDISSTGPLFDPLETAADREIVPEAYPIQAAAIPGAGDTLISPIDMTYTEFDSVSSSTDPTEVYRVQIFTSRLYTEANMERALAEEIFNMPIYLDYELPYYKLRVGDFATRGEAEAILSEIKSIGYGNAWVARVVLRIREDPEYEMTDQPLLPSMPSDSTTVLPDSIIQTDRSREP